jgi:hypothetical protein
VRPSAPKCAQVRARARGITWGSARVPLNRADLDSRVESRDDIPRPRFKWAVGADWAAGRGRKVGGGRATSINYPPGLTGNIIFICSPVAFREPLGGLRISLAAPAPEKRGKKRGRLLAALLFFGLRRFLFIFLPSFPSFSQPRSSSCSLLLSRLYARFANISEYSYVSMHTYNYINFNTRLCLRLCVCAPASLYCCSIIYLLIC